MSQEPSATGSVEVPNPDSDFSARMTTFHNLIRRLYQDLERFNHNVELQDFARRPESPDVRPEIPGSLDPAVRLDRSTQRSDDPASLPGSPSVSNEPGPEPQLRTQRSTSPLRGTSPENHRASPPSSSNSYDDAHELWNRLVTYTRETVGYNRKPDRYEILRRC